MSKLDKLLQSHRAVPKIPAYYDLLSTSERRIVRDIYSRKQKRRCYHCKCLLKNAPPKRITALPLNNKIPATFFDNPIHLHHNHETGLTLGATHAYCNAVLWQYYGE